jgi:hypothetical protein
MAKASTVWPREDSEGRDVAVGSVKYSLKDLTFFLHDLIDRFISEIG